jgi:hypothetical protein
MLHWTEVHYLIGEPSNAHLCYAGDALYLQPAEEGLPLYIAELLGLAEDAHGGKSAEVRCVVMRCCVCMSSQELLGVSARLHKLSDGMCTQAGRAGSLNICCIHVMCIGAKKPVSNLAQAPGLSSTVQHRLAWCAGGTIGRKSWSSAMG